MRGRTILVAGITAALLGGSGVAYSDLRDDGSHVHVTNSMDSPVPVRTDNPLPRTTLLDFGSVSANVTSCHNLNASGDSAEELTSVSAYVKTASKPAVSIAVYTDTVGRYVESLPVTQATATSWGAHWSGEVPLGAPTRYTSDSSSAYAQPTAVSPIVTVQLCVKNPVDPIGAFSGVAVLHPLP